MKLGKLKPTQDSRTLRLTNYLNHTVLPHPDTVDWTKALSAPWGMFGNDQYGDCVWAMFAHAIMSDTANASALFVPSTSDVLAAYTAVTGFDPHDPNSDQGTSMLDGLKYMKATGIDGKQIGPFVAVNKNDPQEVLSALYLFGGLYTGIECPESWLNEQIWRPSTSPIAGGHAIWIPAGTKKDGLTVVTWGEERLMTWDAVAANVDELYASVAPIWLDPKAGKAPNGFLAADLATDLNALAET